MAVITISRQYASQGKFFAQDLAKALKYSYVDKKIYQKIAEKENISFEDLKALESITGLGIDFFQKLINDDYIKRVIGKKDLSFEHNEVVEMISKTILDFALKDNIVIVGRGSQCILQNFPNCYHVKIVREFKDRVNLMIKHGVTEKGAVSTLKRKDEERKNYIKKFYNCDWNSPELYHLTINLSKISTEKGIAIVKKLLEE
jgi:cytidylate kinase